MNVMHIYGVLRVVRVNRRGQEKIAWFSEKKKVMGCSLFGLRKRENLYLKQSFGRLPEERLTYVLCQRKTTIGRALSSDVMLLDPTVSREHARLICAGDKWCIENITENNVVVVNGCALKSGGCVVVQPQDLLIIGQTTLQLIAPLRNKGSLNGGGEGERLYCGDMMGEDPLVREVDELAVAPPPLQFPYEYPARARTFVIFGALLLIILFAGFFFVLNSISGLSTVVRGGVLGLVLALVVPLIPALGISLLVDFIDRYEREPWFLRLGAFLWGAVIAIPAAMMIESVVDGCVVNLWGRNIQVALHAFISGLDAGITEETVKGLGLLLLFWVLRDEFDNVTDGIVYGALIGAGFAMVENCFYFLNNTGDMSVLIVGRIVLGWFSHSTFAICFGAALGYVRHTQVRWRQRVVPWLGYLLAVALHTIFDFVNVLVRGMVPTYGSNSMVARLALVSVIVNYVPPFIAQVGILYVLMKALMHEAAVIREFLVAEVTAGVITMDEYVLLPHSFARNRVVRRILWRYGIRRWWLTRALYQSEIDLAFCKWHVSMGDGPEVGPVLPELVYRKRIQRLRQEIAALDGRKPDCEKNGSMTHL